MAANGGGLIAFESGEVNLGRGLFGGLAMTLGASHQPVMGRVAMLHPGTKAVLGKALSDDDVIPEEFASREMKTDLRLTIGRLRESGRKRLGDEIDRLTSEKNWQEAGCAGFCRKIIQMTDNAPGGEQQMTAIGRALMSRPRLLVLDEPSMGLAPLIVEEIFHRLRTLNRAEGLTILVAGQNSTVALRYADRATVLGVAGLALLEHPGACVRIGRQGGRTHSRPERSSRQPKPVL